MAEWTPEEDDKLKAWFEQGMTAGEMAMRFEDRSRNSVIGRLTRLGMKRGNRDHLKCRPLKLDETHELIVRLRCKPWGWSAASISQALRVSPQIVHSVIHLHTRLP